MAIINTGLTLAGARSEFMQKFADARQRTSRICARVFPHQGQGKLPLAWQRTTQDRMGSGVAPFRSVRVVRVVENWKDTVRLSKSTGTSFSDQAYAGIQARIQELTNAPLTRDYLLSQLLINGATSGFNSYDGVSFFNDAHVSGSSGNMDKLAPSATAEDPTVAELRQRSGRDLGVQIGHG